jgi:hypothetical protein
MQMTLGLRRLGHDAYYFEVTSAWPFDPIRNDRVGDSHYAVPYLTRVADSFGLGDRWAYRRSYSDNEWLGIGRRRAEELLRSADAVFNLVGATLFAKEGLEVRRLVYFGTDPGYHEITFAAGNKKTRSIIDEHDDTVTIGENIGTSACPVPALPRLRATTRQPVLIDLWQDGERQRDTFTTVGNWKQRGRGVVFAGTRYYWSKDREFLRFVELPRRVSRPVELATNLADAATMRPTRAEPVRARSAEEKHRVLLLSHGWRLVDARAFTTDPWAYRDYICASRGEFTVAKDLNVRLRTGWFSERSAYYLAAGRPVVTQNTGFGRNLPTGEGLFAYDTIDEAVGAFEEIESNYDRHSRAARAIAHEYFRAETVLAKLLEDLSSSSSVETPTAGGGDERAGDADVSRRSRPPVSL